MNKIKPISKLKAQRLNLGLNQAQFWTPLGITQSGGSRSGFGILFGPAGVSIGIQRALPTATVQGPLALFGAQMAARLKVARPA